MSPESPAVQKKVQARDVWIVVVSAFLITLAPSFQSFWIDEGTMGFLCRIPSLFDMHSLLGHMRSSEVLMPLTTTYFWAAEKIVGDNEWALRCGNIPWLWLGIVCLALVGKRINWPWLPLLFAIHPVVWFYADEVRPYAIQLGTASWLTLGFVQIVQSEGKQTRGFWNFGCAAAATIAASFLGIFVVTVAGLVLAIKAFVSRWSLSIKTYGILAFLTVLNGGVALAIFSKMHGAAAGSNTFRVGFSNVGFASYELLGFVGLGPGRELIRSSAESGGANAVSSLLLPSVFKLALLVIVYCALAYAAFRASKETASRQQLRIALLAGAVAVTSVACLFGAALESHFPFWGRHLAPSLPFLLVAIGGIAASVEPVWTQRQRLLLFGPLFVLLIFSSMTIRWSPSHAKDDYRTAVAIARNGLAQGQRICWIAAPPPAIFYQLPLSEAWPPSPGKVSIVLPEQLDEPQPDLIIVSKPDLFDHQKLLPLWTHLPGVEVTTPCQSFVVYRLPPRR